MGRYVLELSEVDRTRVATVGGKAAHLGELMRLEGVRVPGGFCVTTEAFRRVVAEAPALGERLASLGRLTPEDRAGLRALAAELRGVVEGAALPGEVAAAITAALAQAGEQRAYAVRSSATAEDLPEASFAGQQDSYLNVVGRAAILEHVRRCWASLFSERALTYRLRGGHDARSAEMAVVVQHMVAPEAAGTLFTADPVTGDRTLASVEASAGLGEALIAGRVTPERYEVRGDEIVTRALGAGPVGAAASARAAGPDAPAERRQSALTDAQVLRLARLGRRIEAWLGSPQDIEWCLAGDDFHIVQSRPITTLYPIPASGDGARHVYISVGHQQMMTDAMKPLGYSLFQLTALRPMFEAGGRLFVDVTAALASPASRAGLLTLVGRSDPLLRDALETLIERGGVVPAPPDEGGAAPTVAAPPRVAGSPPEAAPEPDAAVVAELMGRSQASLEALQRVLSGASGPALLELILTDLEELKRLLLAPESHRALMAGMEATWWLNDTLSAWLGEKSPADVLAQSAPNNVTAEMGLALLDVADAIRPYPEVISFLRRVESDDFLDQLAAIPGGVRARDALRAYLDRYGMRCVGEIDITRPRWSEQPRALLPLLLGNIESFEAGAAARRFERGQQEAAEKARELLARLRALPDGQRKAEETRAQIDRLRAFVGYREHPKYCIVSRYFVYKQALLKEAERLSQARVLREPEDIYFLTFQELQEVVRTQRVDDSLVRQRKAAFRRHQALTPPRVLTSDGEVFSGAYRRDDLPPGALAGLGVSAGIVEGRARVLHDLAEAEVSAGDILVTAYTDPSWTPLFVAVRGLVTEVGGRMTHGSVIAREYGLPAVVAVLDATRRIRDGQRIRVNGTDGYVELLP